MTRLLLDASVLLSAAVARPGTPTALLLDAVEDGTVEMVACERLFGEVSRGFEGSYFRDRLSAEDREAVLTGLERIALMRADPASAPAVLRDPSMTTTWWRWPSMRTRRRSSPAIMISSITRG